MDSLGIRAEQALLGAVLLDPADQQHVLDLVEPGDWRRPWHGQVLAAMRRVQARGGQPGPAEVYAELQNDPDLPMSVSRDAVPLAILMEAAPRAGHAEAYAAIVVEGGIRRQLSLAGSRLAQVAESGDLEAALYQASQARRDLDACRDRWLALPEGLWREAPPEYSQGEPGHNAAHHAAAVRQEIRRLREDTQASRAAGVGEWVAVIARDVAQAVAAGAALRERQVPGSESTVARPSGEVAETAGAGALRDLAAEPSQIARVRGWLRPEHFAVAEHGQVYALMRDMDAAGKPVDPVTVCWEAARRGVRADPAALTGGTGAFAVASARDVYRHGLLAQAAQAWHDIAAGATDLRCPPRQLLHSAAERLRTLEAAPRPQAQHGQNTQVVTLPGRSPELQNQAPRPGREAVR